MTIKQKQQFLQQVQATMTQIGELADRAATLTTMFADRGYDAAAPDPVTNADLEAFGVIQYELGVAINVLQDLKKLASGEATLVNAAARAAVNKWRSI